MRFRAWRTSPGEGLGEGSPDVEKRAFQCPLRELGGNGEGARNVRWKLHHRLPADVKRRMRSGEATKPLHPVENESKIRGWLGPLGVGPAPLRYAVVPVHYIPSAAHRIERSGGSPWYRLRHVGPAPRGRFRRVGHDVRCSFRHAFACMTKFCRASPGQECPCDVTFWLMSGYEELFHPGERGRGRGVGGGRAEEATGSKATETVDV